MCSENIIGCGEFKYSNIAALNTGGIYKIGDEAFRGSKVRSVNISSTVREIGDDAFRDCAELKYLTIDSGTRRIGERAFSEIRDLSDVVIPGTVYHLGEKLFFRSAYMSSIHILPGSLFRVGTSVFENCFAACISLPETVDAIGEWAFSCSFFLKKLTLPHKLEFLGDFAFINCIELESISVPAVHTVSRYAFGNCRNLKNIVLCEGTEVIETGAFAACCALKEIVLPASMKVINKDAFLHAGIQRVEFKGECDVSPGAFPFYVPKHVDSSTGFVFESGPNMETK